MRYVVRFRDPGTLAQEQRRFSATTSGPHAEARERDVSARVLNAMPPRPEIFERSNVSVGGERSFAPRTSAVDATSHEVEELKSRYGNDLIVEPEIYYKRASSRVYDMLQAPPMELARLHRQPPMRSITPRSGSTLAVQVFGRSSSLVPLEGAEVHLFLAGPNGIRDHMVVETDGSGLATFQYPGFYWILACTAVPYGDYWTKVTRGGSGHRLRIVCDALPKERSRYWWHTIMGDTGGNRPQIELPTLNAADALRVGVIDTGCGPHPSLSHVEDAGAFVNGSAGNGSGIDIGVHGTHVCGTIGARAFRDGEGYRSAIGIAPEVSVVSARVFDNDVDGATQRDLADAIDALVDAHEVDLINMSLGGEQRSRVLEDAIEGAWEQGVLVVSAAGNDGGPVFYPAAYDGAIAVSAVGRLGEVPEESSPAIPTDDTLFGNAGTYLADFSNRGEAINVCAPGVGIIAPVPSRYGKEAPFAAMNGTSMASPLACGALATLLSEDAVFQELGRTPERAHYARSVLMASARSIGLPGFAQGWGLPTVS